MAQIDPRKGCCATFCAKMPKPKTFLAHVLAQQISLYRAVEINFVPKNHFFSKFFVIVFYFFLKKFLAQWHKQKNEGGKKAKMQGGGEAKRGRA